MKITTKRGNGDKKGYSEELNNVLIYMKDKIGKEYSPKEYTAIHLIMCFLEKKDSVAGSLLSKIMTEKGTNELMSTMKSVLDSEGKTVTIGSDIEDILKLSREETMSEKIGSEDLLLSMLNPANKFPEKDVLEKMGISYRVALLMLQKRGVIKKSTASKFIDLDKNGGFLFTKELGDMLNLQNDPPKDNSFPYITKYTINLSEDRSKGKHDKLIGRNKELSSIIQILCRKEKNNCMIVGKSGCGKTQLVNGFVDMMENGSVPDTLRGKTIFRLNNSNIMGNNEYKGYFEKKIGGLCNELSKKNCILFIDDLSSVTGKKNQNNETNIADLMHPMLSQGNVRVICAITQEDYHSCVESNKSFARMFYKIQMEPNTKEESKNILEKLKTQYEKYHGVKYSEEVMNKCIDLADKFISDKVLPDSAIDIMDLCGSKKKMDEYLSSESKEIRVKIKTLKDETSSLKDEGDFEKAKSINKEIIDLKTKLVNVERKKNTSKETSIITIEDVSQVVSDLTGIPLENTLRNGYEECNEIEKILKKNVIGQDQAIKEISKILKRNKVGLSDPNKPIGTLLFIGDTGCGKTLIAKKLAEEVYGSKNSLIRLDMSEYSEKSSISRLIGSSPGYVGYEKGGKLTEMVKNKPHSVILMDEIEKANEEIFNLFLQLFDDGRLTDNDGNTVNFKNCLIIMTSNVGSRKSNEFSSASGFIKSDAKERKKKILGKELKNKFNPEFLNRIDKVIYFNSLTDNNYKSIVDMELKKASERISSIGHSLTYGDDVVNEILKSVSEKKEYGARPLVKAINSEIIDKVTDFIISKNGEKNMKMEAYVTNEKQSISIRSI